MSKDKRVTLKEVDWLTEKRRNRLYQLGVTHVDEFYSMARYEPEPTKQHLGVTEEEYRDLLKHAEQVLPEEFVRRHDKPLKPRARGLILPGEKQDYSKD